MVSPEVREQLIQAVTTEFPRAGSKRGAEYVDLFLKALEETPDRFERTRLQSLARHLKRGKPATPSRKELALVVEFTASGTSSAAMWTESWMSRD